MHTLRARAQGPIHAAALHDHYHDRACLPPPCRTCSPAAPRLTGSKRPREGDERPAATAAAAAGTAAPAAGAAAAPAAAAAAAAPAQRIQGAGRVSTSGTTLHGVGTNFLDDLSVGDAIQLVRVCSVWDGGRAGGLYATLICGAHCGCH